MLVAGVFATISIGNVYPVWAAETSMFEIAQQAKKRINGRIVDSAGESVIGVNVLEKEQRMGLLLILMEISR